MAKWTQHRRVDVPACDTASREVFRTPFLQGMASARAPHLCHRRAANASPGGLTHAAPTAELGGHARRPDLWGVAFVSHPTRRAVLAKSPKLATVDRRKRCKTGVLLAPGPPCVQPNVSRVPPFLCFLSFFPAGGVHKVCKLHLTRRAFTVSAKTEAFLHVTAEECSEPHSQLRHPTYELAGVVQLVETCTQAHCFGIRCGHSLASIAIKLLGSTTRTFTSLLRPAACGGSGQVRPLRPG